MRLDLDTQAPAPLFKQLADQLRLKIAQGELEPGDALPSVRQVADMVRVNLNTVAKAYRLLAEEGLVELRHGKGGKVKAPSLERGPVPERAQRELEAWVARMKTRGVAIDSLREAFARALAMSQGEK